MNGSDRFRPVFGRDNAEASSFPFHHRPQTGNEFQSVSGFPTVDIGYILPGQCLEPWQKDAGFCAMVNRLPPETGHT